MTLRESRVSAFALMCGVSFIALSTAIQAQASADQVETVIVTGIRESLKTSQEIKHSSSGVVDAITAEDIGKFPDTNLAESIQRVPGVTIDRMNGEGARVTVRGFGPEYNLVTLNGRSMPGSINANTQSATRSFDFANLASDDIAGLTVTKTGRADVPSGGIGSTIDIRTARPLDHPGFVATGSAKVAYDTTNREGNDFTPNFSGLISDTFFNDRVGILISGSYSIRNSAQDYASNGGWLLLQHNEKDGSVSSNLTNGTLTGVTENPEGNIWGPRSLGFGYAQDQRVRTNVQTVLQLRPVDTLTATFDFTYALFKDHHTEHTFGLWYTYDSDFAAGTVNSHGTLTEVTDAASDMSYSTFDDRIRNELTSVGVNLQWDATSYLALSFDAHHSVMMSGGDPSGNNTFAIQGQTPSIVTPGMNKHYKSGDTTIPLGWFDFVAPYSKDTLDTSTISPLFYQANNNVFNTKVDEARLDSLWTNSDTGLTSIKFGIQYKQMQTRAAAWNSFIGTGYYNAADAGLVPADAYTKISTCDILTSFSGGGCDIATAPYYYTYDLSSFVDATQPKYGPYDTMPAATPTSDNNIKEQTKAIYAQFNFDLSLYDMPLKMTAGMRYEQVNIVALSLEKVATFITWDNPTEFHTHYADTATFSKITANNSKFLPNLDMSLELMPDLLLRTSYSKTLTRPDLAQLVGTTSVGQAPKPNSRPTTVGNPALLPYESQNYDATLEWYYKVDSYVSLNVFAKDVDNFLTTTITSEPVNGITDPYAGAWRNAAVAALASGGNTSPTDSDIYYQIVAMHAADIVNGEIPGQPGDPLVYFSVSRPTNANKVSIHGFELAWQHIFGDTGFGVQASWSIPLGGANFNPLTSETQFALPGLSKSFGLMAFYEKYGFQGRVAFTHRDSFLSGLGQAQATTLEPTYTNAYNQLDASASYDINEHISLVWSGINLTGESLTQHGRYKEQFLAAYQGGARFEFGVHVKF